MRHGNWGFSSKIHRKPIMTKYKHFESLWKSWSIRFCFLVFCTLLLICWLSSFADTDVDVWCHWVFLWELSKKVIFSWICLSSFCFSLYRSARSSKCASIAPPPPTAQTPGSNWLIFWLETLHMDIFRGTDAIFEFHSRSWYMSRK